jgi:hypothetical protein
MCEAHSLNGTSPIRANPSSRCCPTIGKPATAVSWEGEYGGGVASSALLTLFAFFLSRDFLMSAVGIAISEYMIPISSRFGMVEHLCYVY